MVKGFVFRLIPFTNIELERSILATDDQNKESADSSSSHLMLMANR
jgi:hypothetical protein